MTELKYPDKIRAQDHSVGMAYDRGNVYDGEKDGHLPNNTDYSFPWDWGMIDENGDPMWTAEEKDRWFHQERAYRVAMRQDTVWGRKAREYHADSEFKVDGGEFT